MTHTLLTLDPEEVDRLTSKGYWAVYDKPSESRFISAESAYRDFYGTRQNYPFVVVGEAVTAHSSFIIAALLGSLPHCSQGTADLSKLARVISIYHQKPNEIDLMETVEGGHLLRWMDVFRLFGKTQGFISGEELWSRLTHMQTRPATGL